MKKILFTIIISFFSLSSFGQGNLKKEIIQLFDAEMNKKSVHNSFLHVYSKSKKINLQFSGGKFKNGDSVSVKNPFYIASIGKTFTAAAIGLLKDKNQLTFNDKISLYLSDSILNKLHFLGDKDYSNNITIAHLLQHRSGLPDYFEDTTSNGSPNMIEQLFINPNKMWSPVELIQFSKQNMSPLFAPGSGYHYTDTEYVLLGLIIEQVSGLKLHEFFKKHFFEPLKMNHTFMNLRSEPIVKTAKNAEVFVGNTEISNFKSLSADWAGGGLISTTLDLIKFQEGLFTEKIVKKETLQIMQNWTQETQGMYYGFGLRKIVFRELHPSLINLEVIGHSGSTGSFLFYCSNLDTYIAGTLNQTEEVQDSIILLNNIITSISKNN